MKAAKSKGATVAKSPATEAADFVDARIQSRKKHFNGRLCICQDGPFKKGIGEISLRRGQSEGGEAFVEAMCWVTHKSTTTRKVVATPCGEYEALELPD